MRQLSTWKTPRKISCLYLGKMTDAEEIQPLSLRLVGTEKIEEDINSITLTQEDIEKFGDIVGDHSPIHRSTKAAKKMGFEDTPIMGVHLAAIGGRLSREFLETVRQENPGMNYVGQKVIFRKPVYPGGIRKPKWRFDGIEFNERELTTKIVAEKGDSVHVELESRFSQNLPEIPQYDENNLVYRELRMIDPDSVRDFYKHLKEESPIERKVSFAHGVSLVPSTLLDFLKELNTKGEEFMGANREMDSEFYGEISAGETEIEIYQHDEKINKKRGIYIYTFDGVLSQQDIPRLRTRVKCVMNGELNIRSLRERYGLSP